MRITEGIKDKLRRNKSKAVEPQVEIPTSYYVPLPRPPYPSSTRPTSVLEPQIPTNGRPIELQGDKAAPWHPDGFAFMIQEQKREEEEWRRQNDRQRIEEATVRHAQQINQGIEEQRQRAEAEERKIKQVQNASAENVRYLRGLIREKYRLDIYVWSKRKVQKANRKLIMKDCLKADAILQEIYFIVNAWDEKFFEPEVSFLAKGIHSLVIH